MPGFDKLEFTNMNIHYFRYPFSYFLENQKAAGISGFVLWGSVPHIWVDQYGFEDTAEMEESIRKHGIKLLAYAARPYNYSLFSQKGSLQRKHTESYYRFCIDVTGKLDTNRVCIDLWGALRDIDPKRQYEDCIEMLADLCSYAKEHDCAIIVGNVPKSSSALINTFDEVRRLKEDVNMDNCEIALDVCAALDNGEVIEDWLDAFGKSLSMVYIADGSRSGAGYPLGLGCYPVSNVLRLLAERYYRGTVVIKLDREKNELDPVASDRININYISRHLSGNAIE